MDVVAGQDPFEYTIEGLDQSSTEPAGFDVRVAALNSAGYGRPSAALNIKVNRDTLSIHGLCVRVPKQGLRLSVSLEAEESGRILP